MHFLIADTFTDSLARLTNDEQKAVKTTAFDLQVNPANPGMQFHKLDRAKDPNFWSVRVNRDFRLIVHRTKSSLLLCYVDHHDEAYRWAECRKLETHPKTGAAQLIEIREKVKEITVPVYVADEEVKPEKPLLFSTLSVDDLLRYGVPEEWIGEVQGVNEDTFLDLADHLPQEAAEALLSLATGETPQIIESAVEDPFDHPEAQRRFRVIANLEELKRALDYPWEKWSIFLHPAQKKTVEADYNGPARVSGSAGTGKTVVALHRAVWLARNHPDARVLLTTFSEPLAAMLRLKVRRLIGNEPRIGERIEVYSMDAIGTRLYELNIGPPKIISVEKTRQIIQETAEKVPGHKFSLYFLFTEWEQVVDAWQLDTWETYKNVLRLGRKTRLPESRRKVLWTIFEQVRSKIQTRGMITKAELFSSLAEKFSFGSASPFDYAVIDEAQDISVPQLRFLAAINGERTNGLFFAGDLGQRIFQQPFSWKFLGVDIRGRSRTLRINYRTSHQIRKRADLLLAPELADVDGNIETRRGTISIFNGPDPEIITFDSEESEIEAVGLWVTSKIEAGVEPHEIGIFVRSPNELDRAITAINLAEFSYKLLDENIQQARGSVNISTMHRAKGLEFRAVVVMACDDEVIPLQDRIDTVTDESDLEDVYNTERHLLYVACTRARDYLLVTATNPASEFLDDLLEK